MRSNYEFFKFLSNRKISEIARIMKKLKAFIFQDKFKSLLKFPKDQKKFKTCRSHLMTQFKVDQP